MGPMMLKMIASHFVLASAKFGSKSFENSLEEQPDVLKYTSCEMEWNANVASLAVIARSFLQCLCSEIHRK